MTLRSALERIEAKRVEWTRAAAAATTRTATIARPPSKRRQRRRTGTVKHVYTIFRFVDLSVIGDHNSSNTAVGSTECGEEAQFFEPSGKLIAGINGNTLSCGHAKHERHTVAVAWYVARRLQHNFGQFLREKKKYWVALKYVGHYQCGVGTFLLPVRLCDQLSADFPSVCVNVQGNVVHISSTAGNDCAAAAAVARLDDQTMLSLLAKLCDQDG